MKKCSGGMGVTIKPHCQHWKGQDKPCLPNGTRSNQQYKTGYFPTAEASDTKAEGYARVLSSLGHALRLGSPIIKATDD